MCVTGIKWVQWLVVEYEIEAGSSHGLKCPAVCPSLLHHGMLQPCAQYRSEKSLVALFTLELHLFSLKHHRSFSPQQQRKMVPVRCKGQLQYNKLHSLFHRSGWALKTGLISLFCSALFPSIHCTADGMLNYRYYFIGITASVLGGRNVIISWRWRKLENRTQKHAIIVKLDFDK